jgi:hypothetical protein
LSLCLVIPVAASIFIMAQVHLQEKSAPMVASASILGSPGKASLASGTSTRANSPTGSLSSGSDGHGRGSLSGTPTQSPSGPWKDLAQRRGVRSAILTDLGLDENGIGESSVPATPQAHGCGTGTPLSGVDSASGLDRKLRHSPPVQRGNASIISTSPLASGKPTMGDASQRSPAQGRPLQHHGFGGRQSLRDRFSKLGDLVPGSLGSIPLAVSSPSHRSIPLALSSPVHRPIPLAVSSPAHRPLLASAGWSAALQVSPCSLVNDVIPPPPAHTASVSAPGSACRSPMSPGEGCSVEELKCWLSGVPADAALSDQDLAERLRWAQPDVYDD